MIDECDPDDLPEKGEDVKGNGVLDLVHWLFPGLTFDKDPMITMSAWFRKTLLDEQIAYGLYDAILMAKCAKVVKDVCETDLATLTYQFPDKPMSRANREKPDGGNGWGIPSSNPSAKPVWFLEKCQLLTAHHELDKPDNSLLSANTFEYIYYEMFVPAQKIRMAEISRSFLLLSC